MQGSFPLDALGDVDVGLDAVITEGVSAGGAVDGRTAFATEDATEEARVQQAGNQAVWGEGDGCLTHVAPPIGTSSEGAMGMGASRSMDMVVGVWGRVSCCVSLVVKEIDGC